jgi:hypothetical protein
MIFLLLLFYLSFIFSTPFILVEIYIDWQIFILCLLIEVILIFYIFFLLTSSFFPTVLICYEFRLFYWEYYFIENTILLRILFYWGYYFILASNYLHFQYYLRFFHFKNFFFFCLIRNCYNFLMLIILVLIVFKVGLSLWSSWQV